EASVMTTENRWMPYGPPATILQVLHFYRQREVPEKLGPVNLVQIGVSESLIPRTMGTLQFLKLVEEDGLTTERFKALRFANDNDYQHVFRDILQAAYKEIFDIVDPGEATEMQLRNAFHPFSPGGQRSRMITLFLGLCQEAGIALKQTPKQSATRAQRGRPGQRTPPKPKGEPGGGQAPTATGTPPAGATHHGEIDPALTALFRKVPASGRPWPEFELWVAALRATVALTNPTAEEVMS
ncbi:MAG: DUF5343 domain-containing protein, partial [Cyanobacteria bacterium REEB65]|nr:DUF5343 domain-containing protein [Cyanobacteria bacterium REEB65]